MRKIFAFNMVSLDGSFEGPNQDISWHNVDEEFNEFAIEQLSAVDTLLFGRITYQLMATYWPTKTAADTDPIIADLMNRYSKIVCSRTLHSVDWQNTKLITENALAEIAHIKGQAGKDIAIFGSANLISSLMDVIDEHRVMIAPLLLRAGTPLFKGDGEILKLRLVSTRMFNSGNVLLTYEPVRNKNE